MATFKPFLLLISLLAPALVSSSIPLPGLSKGRDYIPCAFYLTIETMSETNAGTTSNVSVTVGDKEGNKVEIPNVVEWNDKTPPPRYNFFQPDNVDQFVGTENCYALASPPCFINITITGTGSSPTWRCGIIEVRNIVHPDKTFYVREWLTSKNNFHASRNLCPPSKAI